MKGAQKKEKASGAKDGPELQGWIIVSLIEQNFELR